MLHRRAILSVALLFILSLVLIGPNKESYHAHLVMPFLEPIYAVTEFGSTWSFFAPDPGPPPLRLEWEVLDSHGEVVGDGSFPAEGYPYFINERQARRIAMARFFYYFDDRHMTVWSDWLCRSHPGANGFRLWKAEAKVPDLYKVQSGEESISRTEYTERRSVGNVYCDSSKAPESSAPPSNSTDILAPGSGGKSEADKNLPTRPDQGNQILPAASPLSSDDQKGSP